MKKLFLMAAVAAMTAVSANAQEKKFWVGGSLGFSSTELPGADNTAQSLTILPEFGYNFNDRWAMGLRFGLDQADLEVGNSISDYQQFSVAPFARYTFLRWKGFSVFADGGISYSDFTGDTDFEDSAFEDTHLSVVGIFVNPGFSLRLSNRFALTGSVDLFSAGYTQHSLGAKGAKTKTYAATLNSPFNVDNFLLGVNFKF